MTVIGIILIVGSFGGFMAGETGAAAVVLALGVLLLVLGVRRKKKKQQAQPTPIPQQPPVYQPPVQPQPVVNQQPGKKTETHKVAGVNYHKDAVESLGDENYDYKMSKKEIIESGMEDEDIFEYFFRTFQATFRFEPDNPHDPNAIAVDVAGEHIGYIKSGSIAHVRKLINEDKIESATCEIYGGKCKRYDSMDETIERETHDYAATVTVTLKS